MSTGTPSRTATARARSTVTPPGAAGVPLASTGLPRLMAARRTPVGARSATTSAAVIPMAEKPRRSLGFGVVVVRGGDDDRVARERRLSGHQRADDRVCPDTARGDRPRVPAPHRPGPGPAHRAARRRHAAAGPGSGRRGWCTRDAGRDKPAPPRPLAGRTGLSATDPTLRW